MFYSLFYAWILKQQKNVNFYPIEEKTQIARKPTKNKQDTENKVINVFLMGLATLLHCTMRM